MFISCPESSGKIYGFYIYPGLSEGSSVSSGPDPKEEELKKEIEEEKAK